MIPKITNSFTLSHLTGKSHRKTIREIVKANRAVGLPTLNGLVTYQSKKGAEKCMYVVPMLVTMEILSKYNLKQRMRLITSLKSVSQ